MEFAPAAIRAHGYCDAHERPLVSPDVERVRRSWRTAPAQAWGYPRLELRTGTSYPAILLDCDGADSRARLADAMLGGDLPAPNVSVWRRGGNAHAAWFLSVPVHRYPGAARRPLQAYARAAEYLAERLQADPGYRGVLTLNPTWDGPEFNAWWGCRLPYCLDELLEAVPKGWRAPARPRTVEGRNVALFRWASREAWRPRWARMIRAAGTKHVPEWRAHVAARNRAWFAPALPDAEVRSVAASAARYALERTSELQLSLIQAARGRQSGAVRRAGSLTELRPWDAEGISRATWYRRRSV